MSSPFMRQSSALARTACELVTAVLLCGVVSAHVLLTLYAVALPSIVLVAEASNSVVALIPSGDIPCPPQCLNLSYFSFLQSRIFQTRGVCRLRSWWACGCCSWERSSYWSILRASSRTPSASATTCAA